MQPDEMENIKIRPLRRFRILFAFAFLAILASEEVLAQFINNQNARMDVRGTSRRTARRVDRRHDRWEGGSSEVYYETAPAAAAAASAAVLYSLPGGCEDRNGLFFCNGIYYQPQMQGTQVVYVQVQDE